jgi:hypothetical protein
MPEKIKSKTKISKGRKIIKKDSLGNKLDKKFIKLADSKETQLHAKDFDEGLNRAEARAASEVMQMAKGGRAMYKHGTRGCKLAMKGKGRAYGKNS